MPYTNIFIMKYISGFINDKLVSQLESYALLTTNNLLLELGGLSTYLFIRICSISRH